MSMEVISPRSALLSNYEVLTLLRELESEQLARQKTALRVKKEEDERVALGASQPDAHVASQASLVLQEDVCENLRTVEVEAIQYLAADYQPTKAQSPEAITQLVRALGAYELTKAEKLQIVNLAPTEAVELYVIVEEIEDRLGAHMEDVLRDVSTSLAAPVPPLGNSVTGAADSNGTTAFPASVGGKMEEVRPGWEVDAPEDEFDDHGAGAGVEGDLEMDDD
ncbi:RNA polymerase Rpb4-domain-containing protein [Phellopilus nigrolimitatus]|nr:RNA polymerase Rpb4-domain-containing protein [Phellopilus nigrolimitatus]